MKKRCISLLLVLLMVLTLLPFSALADSKTYLVTNDGDSRDAVVRRGDPFVFNFTIYPQYTRERYNVYIYRGANGSSNELVWKSSEEFYYTSSRISSYSVTLDSSILTPGSYTCVYWPSYYSSGSWHEDTSYLLDYQLRVINPGEPIHVKSAPEALVKWSLDDGILKFYGTDELKTSSSELLYNWNGWSRYNSEVQQVVVDNGFTTIEKGAFAQMANLEAVYLPASIRTIDSTAFDGCGSLTDVYFGGTESQWNQLSLCPALRKANVHFNASGLPQVNPFIDVVKGEYYYIPVQWAVNHTPQITNGTGANTFSPEAICTRGQVVTFLWRAKGCPEPRSYSNPFRDVSSGDYFYKAVLWAVENRITNGTGANTFSPESSCTRAHVVTFLWRANGEPAAAGSNPFWDVPGGEYYTSAVLWAVSKNITNGIDATHFGPDNPCQRGQIVTFLYRAKDITPNPNPTPAPTPKPTTTPTPTPTTPPTSDEIVYRGTGTTVIQNVNIPGKSYYAVLQHNGERNFIVRLYYGEDKYDYILMKNEIGPHLGVCCLSEHPAAIVDGKLEVQADGDWEIIFRPVSGKTYTNIMGRGDVVTGIFTATKSQYVVNATHDGEHNFIVKVIKLNGGKYDYEVITNEIGAYSGSKIVNLEAGAQYYVYVIADGNWTVDFGVEKDVTEYIP